MNNLFPFKLSQLPNGTPDRVYVATGQYDPILQVWVGASEAVAGTGPYNTWFCTYTGNPSDLCQLGAGYHIDYAWDRDDDFADG